MKRTLLLTLLYFLVGAPGWAQKACTVRNFSVRDGLPANNITAIKQGPRGLIWVATWNGLCCYDGYRFTTFLGEPWGSEHALTTQRISAIEPDSEGNVWVRTYDFLKQIRMQRAEQLIRKSKMTFSEIAYAVGFTDPKYFTKCFKKQTGLTPSEYRSQESAVE